jgi:cytochrome c2
MRASSVGWMLGLATAALACRGSRSLPDYAQAIGGDSERGRSLIAARHCGACHTIPRVTGAAGVVGPRLAGIARRTFIGGSAPNTPQNLARWVRNPHNIDPTTAMPAVGLDDAQALDVAAFLYTLDEDGQ